MNQIDAGKLISDLGWAILPKDQEEPPSIRLAWWSARLTKQKIKTLHEWMDALADNHVMLGMALVELGFRLELRDDS